MKSNRQEIKNLLFQEYAQSVAAVIDARKSCFMSTSKSQNVSLIIK